MLTRIARKLKRRLAPRSHSAKSATAILRVDAPVPRAPIPAGFTFEDERGTIHPLNDQLRYQMKEAWRVFSPLSFLAELNDRGLLDKDGTLLLQRLRGTSTITASLDEMISAVSPYLEKHHDLLLDNSLGTIGKRVLRPTRQEIEQKIQKAMRGHQRRFDTMKSLGLTVPARGNVMEIGFISGGESIVAFERLGFSSSGIDYFYDGAFDSNPRYKEVQAVTGTNVRFVLGDLTKRTSFENKYFNFVYSHQVLEHIENLEGAFSELYRIMAPGGVMYHQYEPYFHPIGGHSFGTLDFPWGHVRLNESDFNRYISDLRPHEAQHAIPWCLASLNRTNTLQRVQEALTEAGFAIRLFATTPSPFLSQMPLDSQIVKECFESNENISLQDIVMQKVIVVAQKL